MGWLQDKIVAAYNRRSIAVNSRAHEVGTALDAQEAVYRYRRGLLPGEAVCDRIELWQECRRFNDAMGWSLSDMPGRYYDALVVIDRFMAASGSWEGF